MTSAAWTRVTISTFVLALTVVAATMLAAHQTGNLPAPPLAATTCLDEKLRDLRDADLENATLLGVGSSAAWRNLDMRVFESIGATRRALNAATCFLYAHQSTVHTDFVLERARSTETIVVVYSPRDFEQCDPADANFVEPDQVRRFLSGQLPGWVVHVVNFRPLYLAKAMLTVKRHRDPTVKGPIVSDMYGTSPLVRTIPWDPPFKVDPRCFDAVGQLQDMANQRGISLMIATVPPMPRWAEKHDPTGAKYDDWIRRLRNKLNPKTVFVDGRAFGWGNERFADPVHLISPYHTEFSETLAKTLVQVNSNER
jgi:hypothetical protein